MLSLLLYFFFFKQKTAYEMRISDWSSDVCSSDLAILEALAMNIPVVASDLPGMVEFNQISKARGYSSFVHLARSEDPQDFAAVISGVLNNYSEMNSSDYIKDYYSPTKHCDDLLSIRSEEHTSELQSLMRISYAVFCLKKKQRIKIKLHQTNNK